MSRGSDLLGSWGPRIFSGALQPDLWRDPVKACGCASRDPNSQVRSHEGCAMSRKPLGKSWGPFLSSLGSGPLHHRALAGRPQAQARGSRRSRRSHRSHEARTPFGPVACRSSEAEASRQLGETPRSNWGHAKPTSTSSQSSCAEGEGWRGGWRQRKETRPSS